MWTTNQKASAITLFLAAMHTGGPLALGDIFFSAALSSRLQQLSQLTHGKAAATDDTVCLCLLFELVT